MAREVFVTLGGEERRLRLTTREAIELKKRFGKTPRKLLGEDIAPSVNGRPTHDFDPEVVVATLFLALRHNSRKLTETQVEGWFEEACRGEGGAVVVLDPLADEFLLSGIVGHSVDILATQEAAQAAEGAAAPGGGEGKGVRPPDNP